MSNCKYLKQKFNHKLECKKDKNRIPFKDCANCPYKEYKCTISSKNCAKSNNSQIKSTTNDKHRETLNIIKLKKKSNKLAKLERNRTSLFTDDLEHCIVCGKKKEHLHEVFFGRNRKNSILFKLVLPLCSFCHAEMHRNALWQVEWKKKGQVLFEKAYPDLDFLEVFGKNYL